MIALIMIALVGSALFIYDLELIADLIKMKRVRNATIAPLTHLEKTIICLIIILGIGIIATSHAHANPVHHAQHHVHQKDK